MTPQSLTDYIKVYEYQIPKDLCESACKNLNDVQWSMHEFYDSQTGMSHSNENELSISYDKIPEFDKINKRIYNALEKYILQDFVSFSSWFPGWNGYTLARFNRYDEKTQMALHCDHIHSMFDGQRKGIPILTILGSLNNDYEGGEFLMFGDQKIELPEGSVIVFPSNFMYPHEVKPVKSGVRYSFVSWAW